MEVRCVECGWVGMFCDLINEAQEDADGDLVGVVNLCPECEGDTEDVY